MGELVEVNIESILPSQNYLNKLKIEYVLAHYILGKEDLLNPPTIIADKNLGDVMIDGHTRTSIRYLFGYDSIEVYRALNNKDLLEKKLVPNMNEEALEIQNKFLLMGEEKLRDVKKMKNNYVLEFFFDLFYLMHFKSASYSNFEINDLRSIFRNRDKDELVDFFYGLKMPELPKRHPFQSKKIDFLN